MEGTPQVIVLGGANGAGKSTAATELLNNITFVNADEVAKRLPGYPSRATDFRAGRLVTEQLDELEARRADLAVETTLSRHVLARRIARLRRLGYHFRLIFCFLPLVELAILRVAGRVAQGGHNIPEDVIRRRYSAGIRNFFDHYQPIADHWGVFDTTGLGRPVLIAQGIMQQATGILEPRLWRHFLKSAGE